MTLLWSLVWVFAFTLSTTPFDYLSHTNDYIITHHQHREEKKYNIKNLRVSKDGVIT